MDWRNQTAAVVPCLNEATGIAALVRAVRAHVNAVIVVDDGSRDDTDAQAREAGALVLQHRQTRGKGEALRTGWNHARSLGFRWALALDGDGQHWPGDIPAFFRCAEICGAALVVGNRMSEAAKMPWLRRRVNCWMSRRLSRLTGRNLPDSQCGFRLARLDALAQLELGSRHFEIESEMLHRMAAAGHRIEFVPIRVIYESERSKIRPWRDTVRWFRWWRSAQDSHSAWDVAAGARGSGNSKVTLPSSSITNSAENGRPALEINLCKTSV